MTRTTPIERAQVRLHLIDQREAQIRKLQELKRTLKKQIVDFEELTEKRNAAVLGGAATIEDALLAYEAALISNALTISNGSVTRAGQRLGMSYQQLAFLLAGRQKAIAHLRTPVRRRKQRSDRPKEAPPNRRLGVMARKSRGTGRDGRADNQFLENRLRNAFDAGVNAERELILDRATRMWEKITEGIKA